MGPVQRLRLSVFICDILLSDIQIGDIDGLFLARFSRANNLANLIILNSGRDYSGLELPDRVSFFMKPIDIIYINDFIKLNMS